MGSRCTWAAHPHWFLHARVCLCVMCTLHTFPHHSSRLEPLYHCPWQLWRLGRWGTGQRGPAKGCHFRCSNWSAHNVRRGAERRPGCAGRSVAALDGWGSRGHWTRPRPYVDQRLQGCGPQSPRVCSWRWGDPKRLAPTCACGQPLGGSVQASPPLVLPRVQHRCRQQRVWVRGCRCAVHSPNTPLRAAVWQQGAPGTAPCSFAFVSL